MQDLAEAVIEDIDVKSADWLNARFLIDYQEREFIVVYLGNRVSVHDPSCDDRLGVIRIGSSTSGAIWKSTECIGEYYLDESGQYAVLSIEEGFKRPEQTHSIHPLVHLLRALTA